MSLIFVTKRIHLSVPVRNETNMSPELGTLDRLLGDDMLLDDTRAIFPDDHAFISGIHGLLSTGDVNLLTIGGVDVPMWRWRQLFGERLVLKQLKSFRLQITPQGAARVS